MAYVLYGALGAILVLLLFAAGAYVGFVVHRRYTETSAAGAMADTPAEREIRRLKADQAAFAQMMNYNADVAYGTVSAQDVSAVKDGDN